MKVYVWLPAEGNTYGHVALETDRYYMSFWPRGDIKADGEVVKAAARGVDADIVYHRDLDFHLEGKREPEVINLPVNKVKDSAINDVLERFLRDNNVDPADVTLEAAERKIDDFLRTGSFDDHPQKQLSLTRYAYVSKFADATFINFLDAYGKTRISLRDPQSCTTFVLNAIVLSFPAQPFGFKDLFRPGTNDHYDPWAGPSALAFAPLVDPLTVPKFRSTLDRLIEHLNPTERQGCVIF